MPLDQPVFVVAPPEVDQGEAELLGGPQAPDPKEVLIQRPDEPLRAAVAIGGSDEGRARLGAEPRDLLLEVAGHVLAAVVVADAEAPGGVLRHTAEALGHPCRTGSSGSCLSISRLGCLSEPWGGGRVRPRS